MAEEKKQDNSAVEKDTTKDVSKKNDKPVKEIKKSVVDNKDKKSVETKTEQNVSKNKANKKPTEEKVSKNKADKKLTEKKSSDVKTDKKITEKKVSEDKANKKPIEKKTSENKVDKKLNKKVVDKKTSDKLTTKKHEVIPAKETKPVVKKDVKKPAVIEHTTFNTKEDKPKENALLRSYRANKKAWKEAGIVVVALALFGVGYGIGHVTTGNNPTIAVVRKAHGANRKLKQQDIDHQLNNTKYAHSIANQQLSLKVLATLYPKQYDKYVQKAQKYIKAQQRTYGGAKNYQQVLSASNSSESDVINNYLLTQMITVSVMHHNKPTQAQLRKIYNKSDNNAYKLSGVLVRTKDQAKAVKVGIDNGSSYTSMKNKINKNDFAYFNRSTPDMKNAMTLEELNNLDDNLADGVSQMKPGQTAIIRNGSKNYFIITLKSKQKQSFKASQSRIKNKYISDLMLNGYGPIQKALKADYKRAGVEVKDKTQFGDIANVQNFYSNNGLNNPNAMGN